MNSSRAALGRKRAIVTSPGQGGNGPTVAVPVKTAATPSGLRRADLAGMVVHDMRTPLMAIDGYLKLLGLFESQNLSADGQNYVAQAREGVVRLNRMISDVLAISRLETEALKINLVQADLAALVRRVMSRSEVFRGAKSIQFKTKCQKLPVLMDVGLIERVLENLVCNALKFAPQTGTIRLRLSATKRRAYFEIEDDGPGIAVENKGLIFKQCSQLETGKNSLGVGLGLVFCKLAVEAHGGRIGELSKPGRGGIFWFALKIRRAE